MDYVGKIWRPPSEGNSFILQTTVGCSHNKCKFCNMYKNKKFKIKDIDIIKKDIDEGFKNYKNHRRVFLADGDALIIPTDKLLKILDYLNNKFQYLHRITTYATPKSINDKSINDLKKLRKKGLKMVYLGLESGSEKVLKEMKKGANPEDFLKAAKKLKKANIKNSITIILGLGGKEKSKLHAQKTGNLVSKIEHPEAVKNIEKIIDASDQILVARGDLGVKMPITKVPIIQKNIVKKARERGKPVIIATQLLESMVENPRPTRAEVNDIASAISGYVDALMLTGETAAGKYPIEAVRVLKEVIKNTENSIDYSEYLNKVRVDKGNISESISSAAVDAAYSLPAKAILCFTASGSTALRVAKFRPKVPVFAFTHNKIVARQLNSVFGIIPFTIGFFQNIDKMFEEAEEILKENSFIKNNDRVIITAGTPIGKTGTTNIIKIVEI